MHKKAALSPYLSTLEEWKLFLRKLHRPTLPPPASTCLLPVLLHYPQHACSLQR